MPVWGATPGEGRDLLLRVRSYWSVLATIDRQYAGVIATARTACVEFASPALARTLYFGSEPGLRTAHAQAAIENALDGGAAAESFQRMVAALGGPADFVERHERHLPRASVVMAAEVEGGCLGGYRGHTSRRDGRGGARRAAVGGGPWRVRAGRRGATPGSWACARRRRRGRMARDLAATDAFEPAGRLGAWAVPRSIVHRPVEGLAMHCPVQESRAPRGRVTAQSRTLASTQFAKRCTTASVCE